MREILFKAKRKNWTELPKEQWWVVGVPMKIENKNMMLLEDNDNLLRVHYTDDEMWCAEVYAVEIDIDTLCRHTGLTDKNGNNIWEGDILEWEYQTLPSDYYECVWIEDECAFAFKHGNDYTNPVDCWDEDYTDAFWLKVIGNIFDNPELLERGE